MPKVYSTVDILASTTTPDVLADSFVYLIRHSDAMAVAATQTSTTFVGRNRHPLVESATVSGSATLRSRRVRRSQASTQASSQARATLVTVTPALPPPTGKLFLNDKALKNARLPKGDSFAIAFAFSGQRLQHLEIRFILKDTKGEILLRKVQSLGTILDPDSPGIENATGWFMLLPNETTFERQASEFEARYLCEIGNGSTREHTLEEGYVTFYET